MERINKIEKIAEAVRNLGADAVLLTTDNSRLYAASGFIASRGMVFVTKDGDACYLTDSRYLEAAERELIEKGFTLVDNTLGSTEGLNELIRRHGVKRLAIEDLHMTIGEYEDLRGTLPVELVHAGMAIDKLRLPDTGGPGCAGLRPEPGGKGAGGNAGGVPHRHDGKGTGGGAGLPDVPERRR